MQKLLIALQLLIKPYTNRIKLGEGGLVVFNFTHALIAYNRWQQVIFETALSLLVMCVLYGYNDYIDAEKDKINPKKDTRFINLVLENQPFFAAVLIVVQILSIMLAVVFVSWFSAGALVVLYLLNYFYSKIAKAIPVLDIVTVALWGGLFVCLVSKFDWRIATAAAVMTGIAHFFQIVTDKDTDTQNKVVTSAVKFKEQANWALLLLCALLMFALWKVNGSFFLMAMGALPFAFFFLSKNVTLSWHVSRLSFFISWLIILKSLYAG